MRKGMFWAGCQQTMRFVSAVLLCAVSAIVTYTLSLVKLSKTDGEREFYVGSASSQGLCRTELAFSEIGRVSGESVYFQIETAISPQDLAKAIANDYNAEIVIEEYVCGIYGAYAYSPLWVDGVYVNGRYVNLHIAIHMEGGCGAVGAPIIFGGY